MNNTNKQKFIANAAAKNYTGNSIVDYLKAAGMDSSASGRTKLANDIGYSGYNTNSGNADANLGLLSALRGTTNTTASPDITVTPNGSTSNIGSLGTNDSNIGGQSSTDSAFSSYLNSMRPSEEETAARKYLNSLVANSKLASERAQNSGETMGFASGETQRVNRNNDLTIQAASDAYNAVKGYNDSNQAISKAQYDYTKAKEDAAAKKITTDTSAFNLSPGQQRYSYNKDTGKYELVASAPTKATTTTKTSSIKAPTATANKAAMTNDVNDAVAQLQQKIKQNNWYGVSPEDYNTFQDYFLKEHGTAGVAALDKAMKVMKLSVDKVGDKVGAN